MTSYSESLDFKFVSLDTFFVQFIILFVVLWVLNKFVFKPYLAYLDEWEEKQKKIEKDYKNIDNLVNGANEQKENILKEARQKSDEIISEAQVAANSKKSIIIEKAENEAKEIVESGRRQIEKDKLSMLSDARWNIVDLIVKFNKKLFWEEKVSREFVDREIDLIK